MTDLKREGIEYFAEFKALADSIEGTCTELLRLLNAHRMTLPAIAVENAHATAQASLRSLANTVGQTLVNHQPITSTRPIPIPTTQQDMSVTLHIPPLDEHPRAWWRDQVVHHLEHTIRSAGRRRHSAVRINWRHGQPSTLTASAETRPHRP